ncbi:MAG: type I 3-dehydroquinate dehydratase [Candidatus Gracilibacteria bacterium]|nr:type I 3-dehydroquinate dehydratase [Candidatus Gracilibacteria bacterium]
MTPLLTVPIQAKTPEAIFKAIPKERKVQAIEIWIDHLNKKYLTPELISALIKQLKKKTTKKLVVVCKNNLERGKYKGSDKEKVDLLVAAAHSGADFIDIGLHSQSKEIQRLKTAKKKAKLILSHHDFTKTPVKKTLHSKVGQMKEKKADIIKVATMCHNVQDIERLMNLALDLKRKKQAHIILGMGEAGIITRLFAKHIGNTLNFVSLDSKTAPGQFDLKTMLSFEKVMK